MKTHPVRGGFFSGKHESREGAAKSAGERRLRALTEQRGTTCCVSVNGGYMCLKFQNFLSKFMENREKSIDIQNIFFYYKRVRAEGKFCVGSCDEPGDCSERR